jgi:hypothetical protein
VKKRKQHFVWEHYLTAWTDSGVLHCDHAGRRFRASTENVAHQRDFYRLQDLSDADLFYVGQLGERLPEPTPMLARRWISIFQIPFDLRRRYESGQARSQEFEAALDELCNNLEEDIHARFEAKAIPLLATLKQLNAGQIFNDIAGIDAAMFLGFQYFRTPGMMKSISGVNTHDLPGFNLVAAWGVLRAIYATAFAHALYARQSNSLVSFLLAAPERGFITGDQPIINVRAMMPGASLTDVELYYPLNPRIGLLLSFDATRPTSRQVQLSVSSTEAYNRMVATASDQQLYAASAEDLDRVLPNP